MYSHPSYTSEPKDPDTFAHFAFFRSSFGFVPNMFRAQTLREDVIDAEALAVGNVLLTEDLLTRKQKESILTGHFGGEPQHVLRGPPLRVPQGAGCSSRVLGPNRR